MSLKLLVIIRHLFMLEKENKIRIWALNNIYDFLKLIKKIRKQS